MKKVITGCESLTVANRVMWSQKLNDFGNYISTMVSTSPLWTGQILERIATEFNQLQFHAVQSKGMPLLDKVRPVSIDLDVHFAVCKFRS